MLAESGRDRPPKFAYQCSVASDDDLSVCIPSDAAAGKDPDVADDHRVEATRCCRRRDSVPEAMFGIALQPGGPCEHLVGHSVIGLDVDNMRPAQRERACFVESE